MCKCKTQDRILDAAETLFARNGYENTSMRMITTEAKANLAAINYHFGSKEELARAVFRRWLTPINEKRIKFLDQIQKEARASGRKPEIEIILRGLLVSTIEYALKDEEKKNLPRLVARSLMEPTGVLRSAFIECVNPLSEQILETMCMALPHLSRESIWMRFHFTTGAMGKAIMEFAVNKGENWNFMDTLKMDEVLDMKTVIDEVIKFATAGMEAE